MRDGKDDVVLSEPLTRFAHLPAGLVVWFVAAVIHGAGPVSLAGVALALGWQLLLSAGIEWSRRSPVVATKEALRIRGRSIPWSEIEGAQPKAQQFRGASRVRVYLRNEGEAEFYAGSADGVEHAVATIMERTLAAPRRPPPTRDRYR